jgi:hypothetical protein
MPKTDNGGPSSWRKKDADHRAREAQRRADNISRRAEVAAAADAGLPIDVWRKQRAEAED